MILDKIQESNLAHKIAITIEPSDMTPLINKEYNKIRKEGTFKGFRKGKTPLGFIKKMYAKNVTGEVISKLISENLDKYVKENELDLLDSPMIVNQDEVKMDFKADTPVKFEYLLGLAPKLELKGLSSSDAYEYVQFKPTDGEIEEQLNNIRRQVGERASTDETIEEGDILDISAAELDGKKVKEGGIESEFKMTVKTIGSEDVKKALFKKKKGDTFQFNIYEAEKDRDRNFIDKYFLKKEENDVTEHGDMFECVIDDVTRVTPAEMNEDFFKQAFGEDVKSEEEAKQAVITATQESFKSNSDNMLVGKVFDNLFEVNNIELSTDYIDELVRVQSIEHGHPMDRDEVETNIKRQLIMKSIVKEHDIKVTIDDIKSVMKVELSRMFQGMPISDEMWDGMFKNIQSNKEQMDHYSEKAFNNKLTETIVGTVAHDVKELEKDAYFEYSQAFNKEQEEKYGHKHDHSHDDHNHDHDGRDND